MAARPIGMRIPGRVLALVTLLLLAACGSETGEAGSDTSGADGSRPPTPSTVPAAPGDVRTRGIVTVMDNGAPEVCLGPVAESWPPQCRGPRLVGWSWKAQRLVLGQPSQRPTRPAYEQQGAVRWGQYALTGRWNGRSLTVLTSVPAALYDATPDESPALPTPERGYDADELVRIAEELGGELPGALTSYADRGHVLVDVTYDDGSLQAWADEAYGTNVVVVTSALVDVPGG